MDAMNEKAIDNLQELSDDLARRIRGDKNRDRRACGMASRG